MMHVAFAADEGYAPHASAMLHSVREHWRGELTFHFLHAPGLPPAVIERMASFAATLTATLRCHEVADSRVEGLPVMGRIPRVMWYRLFLPELLPEVPRVLYLDCDTLAMDDLAPLWNTDLRGQPLGAVLNVLEPGVAPRLASLGLAPGRYFNSGVLLMDLDTWRRDHLSTRIVDYARAHAATLKWPDQDALNVGLARRWTALHPRWNCQNSLYFFPQARAVFGPAAVDEAVAKPGILHFEGGEFAKPWHYLCRHPRRGEYYRHLAATPWPVTPPIGRTFGYTLLRVLPAAWQSPVLRSVRRVRSAVVRRLP